LGFVYFIEIEESNIIVEFGPIGPYKLEGDGNLMLFFRKVPSEVDFLEGGT
jgi:hypothetical protein